MAAVLVVRGAEIIGLDTARGVAPSVDVYPSTRYRMGRATTDYPTESGELSADNAYRQRERIELEAVTGNVHHWPAGTAVDLRNRGRSLMDRLRQMLHNHDELVRINTLKGTFRNMLLTEVTTIEDGNEGNTTAVFRLVFEEVLAAEVVAAGLTASQGTSSVSLAPMTAAPMVRHVASPSLTSAPAGTSVPAAPPNAHVTRLRVPAMRTTPMSAAKRSNWAPAAV